MFPAERYSKIRPWLLTVYLLIVALGTFLFPLSIKAPAIMLLIFFQLLLLGLCKKLSLEAFAVCWRLKILFLFFILVNALLPGRESDWRWIMPKIGLEINLSGIILGLMMSGQISLVVLTSYVVRTISTIDAFIRGLRAFHINPLLAYSLDSTLALLTETEVKIGGEKFGAKKYSRKKSLKKSTILKIFCKQELNPFFEKISINLAKGKERAQALGLESQIAHDVGVISGISALMMVFKIFKFLPGIPFAPGIKAILFIPLYILAAKRTHSRWGATVVGIIMGLIAFLNGDGRYGIFGVLHHVTPAICIDIAWSFYRYFQPKIWTLSILGIMAAIAMTSTEFCLVMALGSRVEIYIFPTAKLLPNLAAGILSGFVSYPLLLHFKDDSVSEK